MNEENKFELKLTPDELKACEYLDELHNYKKFFEFSKPSNLLKGALWQLRNPDKGNPERVHQAAHSIREIFYSLGSNDKIRRVRLQGYSNLTLEEKKSLKISLKLHEFYTIVTAIAHHFASDKGKEHWVTKIKALGITVNANNDIDAQVLEQLVTYFIHLLKQTSLNLVDIHKKVQTLLSEGPDKISHDSLAFLFNLHFDAKNYFYSKATPEWFEWLLTNGFLECIKTPVDTKSPRQFNLPEMQYLVRISATEPTKFADFFVSFKVDESNYDISVLNQVIWASEKLPAIELKKLVKKFKDESWAKLLGNTRNSGFQYDGMFDSLVAAEEWPAVIDLATAILVVKPKNIEETNSYLSDRDIFYVDDVGYSKVYNHLLDIAHGYQEQALELAYETLIALEVRNAKEKGEVHPDGDNLNYMDVDFFALDIAEEPGRSSREEAKNVAATFGLLLQKVINANIDDETEVKRLYSKFVAPLPETRSMWRLRLYAMSLCPQAFKDELRAAFFKLFEVGDKYHEIDGGTEFQKALHKSFFVLEDSEQRDFISKTFTYFTEQAEKFPDEKYHLHSGWQNISCIYEHLTQEEKSTCKDVFKREPEPDYEPGPLMGQSSGGMVSDRSPVNLAEHKVVDILTHLKTDWSPNVLSEKFKDDDFLRPRNANGLGDAIKADLKIRTQEYLVNATGFFDRDSIHPHYTYSFLRGIEEMLRNKELPSDFDWVNLFALFESIKSSGLKTPFDNTIEDGRWLSRWIPVHDAMADILLLAQTNTYDEVFPFRTYRDKILSIIKYCVTIDDPNSERNNSEDDDLHGIAINSVRGRVFQVFTHFVQYDDKPLTGERILELKDDVRDVYIDWLQNEPSRAVRFMFGHYLQPFYFRNKDWFKENIIGPLFFGENEALNQATWEGYLNQSLHEELLNLLGDKYISSLQTSDTKTSKHGRVRDYDELIGTHVALAFLHFEKFTLENTIFKTLWGKADSEKQKEFVSFIGRHFAHRNDEWRTEHKVNIQKLMDLWDWILGNVSDTNVLSGFGHWVSHERDSFEITWLVEQVKKTVKLASGNIDWDYGIIQNLEKFANVNPEATLEILEDYLLLGDNLNPHRERWFMIDRELSETIKVIYTNEDLKQRVEDLVNKLMHAGGEQFWPLEQILD